MNDLGLDLALVTLALDLLIVALVLLIDRSVSELEKLLK